MRMILATALLCAGASSAQAEADHAAIAQASLTEVIRPFYAALAEQTGALTGKVETLCGQPSAAPLNETKTAFAATVSAWSKVEILRFGPVTQDHRYERLFFWPDPKGLGLRQLQDSSRPTGRGGHRARRARRQERRACKVSPPSNICSMATVPRP